jgi:hypothetical protein
MRPPGAAAEYKVLQIVEAQKKIFKLPRQVRGLSVN